MKKSNLVKAFAVMAIMAAGAFLLVVQILREQVETVTLQSMQLGTSS